ncbi:hypothetical protein CA262_20485 [Sphingobium sp. GW456-12-10-14-TSB1]|nr:MULTISPECIES: DUF1778 domain-containing protein [Sphingomonadaceae]OUC52965.1 hypothetical protein CA262_20485 [Sphingobium sp. GW456-12-10-14-TSB1]QCI92922.1 DUF1778 domain-containing protein [Novosphingobium sp. EMRT-2]
MNAHQDVAPDGDGTARAEERASERMGFRTKPHVKRAIQRAAAYSGVDDSVFVINAAYRAALETIDSHERTTVSRADFQRIMDAIDNPPPPTDALREAFERHIRMVESR